jgi:hypothetical protein
MGEAVLADNVEAVLKSARGLAPAARYELLAQWVLPGPNHSSYRLTGVFPPLDPPPGRAGNALEAPALELLATARALGKLDELAARPVPGPDAAAELKRGAAAWLLLLALERGRDADARAALDALGELAGKLPAEPDDLSLWPLYLSLARALDHPGLRERAGTTLAAVARSPAKTENFSVLRQHLLALGARTRPITEAPRLDLLPLPPVRAAGRGQGRPAPRWVEQGGSLWTIPGAEEAGLVFRSPLRGDFEVIGEIEHAPGRTLELAYGGLQVELRWDGKLWRRHFTPSGDTPPAEPPEPPPAATAPGWSRLRLTVSAGKAVVAVEDRTIQTVTLPADGDPWLVFRAGRAGAGLRNLRLTGAPTIPESIRLVPQPRLPGWTDVFEAPDQPSSWARSGSEIRGRLVPVEAGLGVESALVQACPLFDEESVTYEFYYSPGKVLVHPAVDRLTFLLDPAGVHVHWRTDGVHDRTGLSPENRSEEPISRPGGALPLEANRWNRMHLRVNGQRVLLELNGTPIGERALDAGNRRTFGLFYFADQTEARVRNVVRRGTWPRQLPPEGQLRIAEPGRR